MDDSERAERRRPRHRTVDRLATILETVVSRRGATLTELAVALDAPVSSIQKLVNGLVAAGYLDESERRFQLGPAPHVLSLRAGRSPVRTVNHDDLVALQAKMGIPVLLAVRVGDDAIYVDWAGGDEPFDYALASRMRGPLTATAAGRVLLAHLPERDRREWVAEHLRDEPARGAEVLAEAESVRAAGVAHGASGPLLPDNDGVAAPVWQEGRVVAAVSATDHRDRLRPHAAEYAELLVDAARRWSQRG